MGIKKCEDDSMNNVHVEQGFTPVRCDKHPDRPMKALVGYSSLCSYCYAEWLLAARGSTLAVQEQLAFKFPIDITCTSRSR